MAYQKKTEATEKVTVTQDNGVNENEVLKQQINDLTALVQNLLQQNQQIKQEQETVRAEVKKTASIFETTEEKLDIDPREYVRVISLTNGGLNLQAYSTVVRLNEFGSSKLVTFEDVRAIVDNHSKLAHEGGFLIQSEKAVKALYLDDAYEKFISKESIDNILELPVEEIIYTLKSITLTLKSSIVERIIIGIASNDRKFQDRYKINTISDYIGKDLFDLAREIEN